MFKENNEYDILTPNGFKQFDGIRKVFKKGKVELTTSDGKEIKCSRNHSLLTTSGMVMAHTLKIGDLVIGNDGPVEITNKTLLEGIHEFYDLVNVSDGNVYLTNGIVSHNCSFLGTGETYIDGEILMSLREEISSDYKIKYNNRMRIWEDPIPGHDYAIGIDCSIGRQRDYSAFHIFDIYNGRQVGEFYSNRTPINEFAKIICDEARLYNTAYVLPERNTIGNNLIYFLKEVHEYENLMMDDQREIGVQVTQKNRETLLADMEFTVRSGRVKLLSERLVNELFTFIIDPDTGKIEADANCHDDLIMALCLTIKVFNELRSHSTIEKESVIDNGTMNPTLVLKTKYSMKTATGGVSDEDIAWLLKN